MEEPSKTPGVCTHQEAFKSDKDAVLSCKSLKKDYCKYNPNC